MQPKRWRILYVEKPASVGGSVVSLYELIRGLDTSLFEPVVLFHGPNPYRERFKEIGVQVITLNTQAPRLIPAESTRDIAVSLSRYGQWLGIGYRTAKQAYLIMKRDPPVVWRVVGLIKKQKIDLVHHNNSLPKNRDTILAAWLANVPQVTHVRMFHKFSFWEKFLARSISAHIYISKAVEQHCCQLGLPADKGQVIYNPFDIQTFVLADHTAETRAEFGLSCRDWLLSNIGRIEPWKGQDDFLRALARVVQTHPNVKALIVGNPEAWSQAYYQKLQRLVTDLQLSEHVIFTGFRNDIPSLMAASDIVVHSSSEAEPFGRVIVEAMAAGRPVIATAAGGVLDIIEDQVNGLLVPPGNVSLMAKAIQQLLQDRARAISLGQRAQQQVRERFSIRQHVDAVQNLYQKILA